MMLAGGLAACNTNDDNAFNDRYDNNTRPIGYYTDDNDNTRRGWIGNGDNNANRNNNDRRGWFGNGNNNGNGTGFGNNNDGRGLVGTNDDANRRQSPFMDRDDQVNNRNEGPITDMMDRDDHDQLGNNPQNNNRRGTMENRGNVGYYDGTDGKLARKVSDRVKDLKGVQDARTIVYGDQIIIGVDTKNDNDRDVDRQVRNAVRDIVQTRNVTVVSDDDDMFNRIRTVDTNLRNGNGMDEVQSDINAILDDLGDAISRPFQNNR